MSIVVHDLRTQDWSPPFCVSDPEPRLSWRLRSGERNVLQTAHRIQVAADPDFAEVLTDTGVVESVRSHGVDWPGAPLASRQRAWWRVRVHTSTGESEWSPAAPVEAPLWAAQDWTAGFVLVGDTEAGPSPLLRKRFELDGPTTRARLYVTARGLYRVEINGRPVGDELLAPGWTSYDHRLAYRTHDVTDLLGPGPNTIGAELADGWYRGHISPERHRNVYGTHLGLLAQLEITLSDGSTQTVGTDGSWEWTGGPRRAADIYDGETYDLRLEQAGWSSTDPGASTAGAGHRSTWAPVTVAADDRETGPGPALLPAGPPVRAVEELPPVARWTTPEGRTVIDFGQNLVGWPRLELDGPEGTTVHVRHAEVLEADGSLHTAALRSAKATDTYILDGRGPTTVEPRFTFHGFRYAEIASPRPGLQVGAATAVVVSSDLERIGGFSCSDELVNRLQANIVRSQRGNFVSIPTDCPQRDERLGWTGDIQVFAPTGSFNFDADAFLSSWLADLARDQRPSGGVPPVIPRPGELSWRIVCAAWGDAAVMVPWSLYEAYGDLRVLERQYDSMRAWVEYEARRAGEDLLWTDDFQFGDWLDPDAPAGEPQKAKVPGDYVATAYLAESARILSEVAALLDRPEDSAGYADLAGRVRRALWAAWPR